MKTLHVVTFEGFQEQTFLERNIRNSFLNSGPPAPPENCIGRLHADYGARASQILAVKMSELALQQLYQGPIFPV